jgi:hypothetical protein
MTKVLRQLLELAGWLAAAWFILDVARSIHG